MAGLVIFQSHSFSLFNTAITVDHPFNITSLFHRLFELGNRHLYRLTRPRKAGNLGNRFASNNNFDSPIQCMRLASTVAHFISQILNIKKQSVVR
jgi:hypothetical protein